MKLKSPTAYQGGKQRIARNIIDIMFPNEVLSENENFYDLCCGSGAITLELFNKYNTLPKNTTMIDNSLWGDFWECVSNGNFIIDRFQDYLKDIPEDKSKIIDFVKQLVSENPYDGVFNSHIYKFLIIQSNAFGGTPVWIENDKWKKGGGYKDYWLPKEHTNRQSPVNPFAPMPDEMYNRVGNILWELDGFIDGKKSDVMNHTEFPEQSIIYIDPPYINTTNYGKSNFNIYDWIEQVSHINKNITVYISEGFKMENVSESFMLSGKRTKGNIYNTPGNNHVGHEEWLNKFIF